MGKRKNNEDTGRIKKNKHLENEQNKKAIKKRKISETDVMSDTEKLIGFFEILKDSDISRFVGFNPGTKVKAIEIESRTKDLDEHDLHIGKTVGEWVDVDILEKTKEKHSVYDDPDAIDEEIEIMKEQNNDDWMDMDMKIHLPIFRVLSSGVELRVILVNNRIARSLDNNKLYFWKKTDDDWEPKYDEDGNYIEEDDEYYHEDIINNSGDGILVHSDKCSGDCMYFHCENEAQLEKYVKTFVDTLIDFNVFGEFVSSLKEEELGFLYMKYITIIKEELFKTFMEEFKRTKTCVTSSRMDILIKKIIKKSKHEIYY